MFCDKEPSSDMSQSRRKKCDNFCDGRNIYDPELRKRRGIGAKSHRPYMRHKS